MSGLIDTGGSSIKSQNSIGDFADFTSVSNGDDFNPRGTAATSPGMVVIFISFGRDLSGLEINLLAQRVPGASDSCNLCYL